MNYTRKIKTFTDKYPYVGPLIWVLSAEYFIVQYIVARDWRYTYSLTKNTISDLGNTVCGIYGGRYVCSPLHNLMNLSFISLGFLMLIGAILIQQEFNKTKYSIFGFGCLALAGIGTILVGIFPENTINVLHSIGAFLPFLIGNIGIIILGFILKLPKYLKIYTILSGCICLIALIFFITKTYLGIGEGGIERIVAYPQTVWLIVFGVYISKNRYYKEKKA